ncbi:MAG TPA: hypothetical protein VHF22_07275, partial [Planctomycetota bacterium]|nr:hypothetical protein [Planctomycetota bacterium]
MTRARRRAPVAAALLAGIGVLLVFRFQAPLTERLVARRLAQDLEPDEAVQAARALEAADPGVYERLGPEAR